MFRYLLSILISLPLLTYCQKKQETLSQYIIIESSMNGVDRGLFDLRRGGYLVFYRNSKGELLFANVSSVTKEQSVGLVMDMKTREEKKTSSTYQRDIIQFKWLYANTYDNKTGVANITIRKTYEPKNVYFIMKMVLSNRDEIIYKGYFKDKDFDEDYIP